MKKNSMWKIILLEKSESEEEKKILIEVVRDPMMSSYLLKKREIECHGEKQTFITSSNTMLNEDQCTVPIIA